ncbi:MAG: hypothetical protein RL264_1015 [Bacteroidota bacterium]|jgi:hypothetical protein
MSFETTVYIITAVLLVLIILYSFIRYLISLRNTESDYIRIEFSETVIVQELTDLGEFSYNASDKELQNEIVLPFWTNFKLNEKEQIQDFEITFFSEDNKLNTNQINAFHQIKDKSFSDWKRVTDAILDYYQENYSEYEDIEVVKTQQDLKKSIQLSRIIFHEDGNVGMTFNCSWDEEHGLGIILELNGNIEIGEASEAC